MEKKQRRKFDQQQELQFDQYIDWLILSYEDDLSSEEEGPTKLVTKWIIGKKRKCLPKEQPDQQLVKDLIINVKKENLAQPSAKQRNSKETIIDEAFKNIPNTKIPGLHYCSKIFDPSNF